VSGNLRVAVLVCVADEAEHPMRTLISEFNPEALFMDGHDDALIGVASRYGISDVACYDYDKVIAAHVKDGMSEEEAVEFFEFNQIGAWLGENTPVFVRLLSAEKPPDQSQKPSS
jgi:hypothetical protein